MIELKGNDSQKQKASQPCTHVHFCNKSVSAVMAVTEFQAFGLEGDFASGVHFP